MSSLKNTIEYARQMLQAVETDGIKYPNVRAMIDEATAELAQLRDQNQRFIEWHLEQGRMLTELRAELDAKDKALETPETDFMTWFIKNEHGLLDTTRLHVASAAWTAGYHAAEASQPPAPQCSCGVSDDGCTLYHSNQCPVHNKKDGDA